MQNMQDAKLKGIIRTSINIPRVKHPSRHKFSNSQIDTIIHRIAEGETTKTLALEFGCSRKTISFILNGRGGYSH